MPFLKSLVRHDLGLNPGLPDHWRTLYPLGQWAGFMWCSLFFSLSVWGSQTLSLLTFPIFLSGGRFWFGICWGQVLILEYFCADCILPMIRQVQVGLKVWILRLCDKPKKQNILIEVWWVSWSGIISQSHITKTWNFVNQFLILWSVMTP